MTKHYVAQTQIFELFIEINEPDCEQNFNTKSSDVILVVHIVSR